MTAMFLKTRFNIPLLVLANLVSAPFTLFMFIPFMRIGEILTRSPAFPLDIERIRAVAWSSPRKIIAALLHSVVGWMVLCPFIALLLVQMLLPLLSYVRRRLPNSVKDERAPGSAKLEIL